MVKAKQKHLIMWQKYLILVSVTSSLVSFPTQHFLAGLSRTVQKKNQYMYAAMLSGFPVRWTAVEALEKNQYSVASDVWSFGVLVYEIMTWGAEPYAEITDNKSVFVHVIKGGRLSKPEGCPQHIYDMMVRCWSEPELRPTFPELRKYFLSLMEAPEPGSDTHQYNQFE